MREYEYNNQLLPENAAILVIESKLGKCSGDIATDLQYLASIERLENMNYSAERLAKRRLERKFGAPSYE